MTQYHSAISVYSWRDLSPQPGCQGHLSTSSIVLRQWAQGGRDWPFPNFTLAYIPWTLRFYLLCILNLTVVHSQNTSRFLSWNLSRLKICLSGWLQVENKCQLFLVVLIFVLFRVSARPLPQFLVSSSRQKQNPMHIGSQMDCWQRGSTYFLLPKTPIPQILLTSQGFLLQILHCSLRSTTIILNFKANVTKCFFHMKYSLPLLPFPLFSYKLKIDHEKQWWYLSLKIPAIEMLMAWIEKDWL